MANNYMNKREVMSFRKLIPKNTKQLKLTERIKADGTIEGINIRFYPGQQMSLQVMPYVSHKGNKREDMITYAEGTDGILAGDDDFFSYPVTIPVEYDDEVVLIVNNIDPTYDYNLALDVVIDYYAGKERVIGGLL